MMQAIATQLHAPGRSLAAARDWLAQELHRAVRESMDEGFLATEKGMRYAWRVDGEAR